MADSKSLHACEGLAPEAWETFARGSPHTLVFHRNDWLEVLRDTQGSSLRRYGLYADKELSELVGIMPVLIGRFGPFRIAGSPLVVEDTPYMGPAVPEEFLTHALAAVRDAVRHEASFFRTLLPSAVPLAAQRALGEAGFSVTTKTTHRLDLSRGLSAIWDGLEGRCRTAVRRAEKAGVNVRRVTEADRGSMTRYFALVQQVFAQQGRSPPNGPALFHELWQRVRPLGLVSLAMAQIDGEDVAGALLAHDDRRVYYLDGASDRAFRNVNPTNLVLWKALEWAVASGKREFDFVGSDIPRLARFKASFGGRLVEHSCVEWARSKAVWLARDWFGRSGRAFLARLQYKRRSTPS
jgi:CelD/BcsL family acetyltransferase involved in cellulose biosynthesis